MSSSSTVPSTPGRQPGRAAQIHMPCVVLTIVPPTRNASPPAAPKRWFIRHDLPLRNGPAIASTQSGPGKLPSHSSVSAWSSISPDAHEARRRGVCRSASSFIAPTRADASHLASQAPCFFLGGRAVTCSGTPSCSPTSRTTTRTASRRRADGQTVFVDSRHCIYRSQDAGDSWQKANGAIGLPLVAGGVLTHGGPSVIDVSHDFKNNGRVYLARDDKPSRRTTAALGRRRRSPEGCPYHRGGVQRPASLVAPSCGASSAGWPAATHGWRRCASGPGCDEERRDRDGAPRGRILKCNGKRHAAGRSARKGLDVPATPSSSVVRQPPRPERARGRPICRP